MSDRIILYVAGSALLVDAATTHREWIAGEVLARDIVIGDTMPEGAHTARAVSVELDGSTGTLALTRDS